MEQLLTVEDVAERLQVHPETVRKWLREGKLEGVRLTRRAGWRVRPAALEAWLEQATQEAKTAA